MMSSTTENEYESATNGLTCKIKDDFFLLTKDSEMHYKIWSEIAAVISEGDVNALKTLASVIEHFIDTEDRLTLESYYYTTENRIKYTNVIILSCKYNKVNILEYLFSNESKLLDHLSVITRNTALPTDVDEKGHNALYYAILSNNDKLLHILINKWPGDYFKIHGRELNEILSSSYAEFRLKNIFLSQKIELLLLEKLINFNFFSNAVEYTGSYFCPKNIDLRIKLLNENVSQLTEKYCDVTDAKLLFTMESIAKNIYVLKQNLKSTYDVLPWEEIEFCLICYIIACKKRSEFNIFCHVILNATKITCYLKDFMTNLNQAMKNFSLPRTCNFSQGREKVVQKIIKEHPEFIELYRDYDQLRDTYSLERISTYANLAVSADPSEKEGILVIIRSLQVIGECLKNTLESPKLSSYVVRDLLFLSLSENTRKVMTDLRNSLSHEHSLSERMRIETNSDIFFFEGLQKDIKEMTVVVTDVLYYQKGKIVRTLLEKLENCETQNEMQQIGEIFETFEMEKIEIGNFELDSLANLEELVQKLSNEVPEKTSYERNLFDIFFKTIQSHKNSSKNAKVNYFLGFTALLDIMKSFSKDLDHNAFRGRQFRATLALENMCSELTAADFDEISELTLDIFHAVSEKIPPENDEILKTVYKILHIVECGRNDIRSIKKFGTKLKVKGSKVKKSKISNMPERESSYQLSCKLAELKHVLSMNDLDEENLDVTFSIFPKSLQAVVEMLVLDIMAIYSEEYLENNSYFLDENVPVLVGRALRNHLAHHNIAVDLMSTPLMAAVLNARKLAGEEDMIVNKKKIGRLIPDDPSKVQKKHAQNFKVVDIQEKMFQALEAGDTESFEHCLTNGADIHGRDINSCTALHFATKCSDLKIIKYLIIENINLHAVNSEGQNVLHTAAAFGRGDAVEFLLEEMKLDVDFTDKLGKTALHIAAERGQLHVVQALLKNKANPAVTDKSGLSPVFHAVRNNHVEIIDVFLGIFPSINLIESSGGFSLLHEAAERGHTRLVELFLQKKANVNATTDRMWTPLHAASLNGHFSIVEALIKSGADVNAKDTSGCTALHFAAENGYERISIVLLEHGANVNATDKIYFNTPLHCAAMDGREKLAAILLQNGALADVSTREGMTPLHFAAHRGNLEIVKILLLCNIKIDARNVENCTPLHLASERNHKEIVECLVKSKARINSEDINGFTPLHVAASHGSIDICRILTEEKADTCIRNIDGLTPLHVAATNGNIEVIDLLLRSKAEINSKCNLGCTPLYLAALNGNIDAVTTLMRKRAYLDELPLYAAVARNYVDIVQLLLKTMSYGTFLNDALHLAVKFGSKKMIEMLLERGAEIDAKKYDMTPLILAVKENRKEIVEMLLDKGADVNANDGEALEIAVFQGLEDIVQVLLKYSPDVYYKSTDNISLLHLAAKAGHINIINSLLAKQFDANARTVDKGLTPLFLAAHEGHHAVVEILISKGAIVNLPSNEGTPLHAAAALGHNSVAKILLESRADIYSKDRNNRTAFELAVARGHVDVLKTFIRHGKLDINFKSSHNWTLLHIASQGSNLDMVKCLIDEGSDIRSKDFFGSKPIHIAAMTGQIGIVKHFIRIGLSVDELGMLNQVPMHYAAKNGQIQMVNFLLSEGADVCAKADFGVTPLHVASSTGFTDVVKCLMENGAIYDAVDNFNRKPSEWVVAKDVENVFESTKKLFQVIKKNLLSDAEKYIKSGALVNARNAQNSMPLHYAAWKGYDAIVDLLLQNGANPDSVAKERYAPLHYATKFSFLNVVKSLLASGAKYNVVSKTGSTPINFATDGNILNLLKLLNEAFKEVEAGSSEIINELNKIKDVSTIKSLMRARNSENETLVVFAIRNNFGKVQELKEVGQGNISQKLNLALQLSSQGNYKMALNLIETLHEKREEILGPDNPGTFDIQMHIIKILYEQGDYQKALCMLRELLQKQMKVQRLPHEYILETKRYIALVLHRQEQNEESLKIFQEVYQAQKESIGPNHSNTLVTQHDMALTLNALGRYEEALVMFHRVYKNEAVVSGSLSTRAVRSLNNIAMVLMNQENHDEAFKIYKEVLQKKIIIFGCNHPDTLNTRHSIACLLSAQGKEHEALIVYHEVLKNQQSVIGPNHPDTLTTEYNIANVYFSQKKWYKALEVYKRTFDRRKNILGENSPQILDTLSKMEFIYLRLRMDGHNEPEILQELQKVINVVAIDGDVNTIQFLLDSGTDVNVKDVDGRTPLHFAVSGGHLSAVKLLLENGADATEVTNKNNTALHIAASKKYGTITDILLKAVKIPKRFYFLNTQTMDGGMTALHIAAKNGCLEIVKSLLEHGASYNSKNKDGKTPQNLCGNENILKLLKLLNELFEYARTGNFEIVSRLRRITSDELPSVKNARNNLELTLLQVAIVNKHSHMARTLFDLLQNE